MNRLGGVLGIALVLVVSMGFAALNGGQRVTLRLGFTTFYRVPLTAIAFGALILGMVVMLLAGIHSDLRVRKILRERLAEEDREERARIFVDRLQTNLFEGEADAGPESPVGVEAGTDPDYAGPDYAGPVDAGLVATAPDAEGPDAEGPDAEGPDAASPDAWAPLDEASTPDSEPETRGDAS
jgi:uncharacterized integral membrane protein